jgi:enoyl-CoA hydratase/carnithine racemase
MSLQPEAEGETMSEKEAFRSEVEAGKAVATITLSQPENGNLLTTDHIRALGRRIRELGSREEVKLVVVRAEGENFCMGRKPAPPPERPPTALQMRNGVTEPLLDMYADARATPVPVLAVIQGQARGFGCALAGCCDLVIAADSARFSMPEMDHNLPPTLAMSAVLNKVPPKRLMHLVYTRLPITAAEALSWGLVTEVAPLAELEAATERLVARMADRERAALCAVKEYLNCAPYVDPAAASRLASSLLAATYSSILAK